MICEDFAMVASAIRIAKGAASDAGNAISYTGSTIKAYPKLSFALGTGAVIGTTALITDQSFADVAGDAAKSVGKVVGDVAGQGAEIAGDVVGKTVSGAVKGAFGGGTSAAGGILGGINNLLAGIFHIPVKYMKFIWFGLIALALFIAIWKFIKIFKK
jgi:hypothetical protein